MANCVFCARDAEVVPSADGTMWVDCNKCGKLKIADIFYMTLTERLDSNTLCRPRVKHWLRKRKDRSSRLTIDEQWFEEVASEPLPTPREQVDALVRWIGDELRETPGNGVSVKPDLAEFIGANDEATFHYIVRETLNAGLLGPPGVTPNDRVGLSFKGWDRYEELLRSHSEGAVAFMAMPFDDACLDRMFIHCFQPAVERTGFRLYRIIDNQGAGVIDDQLRVEIRKARFLISDISDRNPGAYWEAGFAEGLGKPVIYTCKKSVFHHPGPKIKPHFDTNHCVTVLWDEQDLPEAAKRLSVTIRATLPSEAKMED